MRGEAELAPIWRTVGNDRRGGAAVMGGGRALREHRSRRIGPCSWRVAQRLGRGGERLQTAGGGGLLGSSALGLGESSRGGGAEALRPAWRPHLQ